jgi:diphosphomevalonate decarboxylase
VVVWGTKLTSKEAPIYMALNFKRNSRNFKKYQDTILLVDKGEKQVSNTVGHDLMHNHPYAEGVYKHMKLRHADFNI